MADPMKIRATLQGDVADVRILMLHLGYAILAMFLLRYARKIDRLPAASPVFKEDQPEKIKYTGFDL